jgi:hypothetical protein
MRRTFEVRYRPDVEAWEITERASLENSRGERFLAEAETYDDAVKGVELLAWEARTQLGDAVEVLIHP